MATNQYELAKELGGMVARIEKMVPQTGYYDRDEAINEALATLLGTFEETLDVLNYADECEQHYQPDPSDLAKAEAELRDFLAYCNEVGA